MMVCSSHGRCCNRRDCGTRGWIRCCKRRDCGTWMGWTGFASSLSDRWPARYHLFLRTNQMRCGWLRQGIKKGAAFAASKPRPSLRGAAAPACSPTRRPSPRPSAPPPPPVRPPPQRWPPSAPASQRVSSYSCNRGYPEEVAAVRHSPWPESCGPFSRDAGRAAEMDSGTSKERQAFSLLHQPLSFSKDLLQGLRINHPVVCPAACRCATGCANLPSVAGLRQRVVQPWRALLAASLRPDYGRGRGRAESEGPRNQRDDTQGWLGRVWVISLVPLAGAASSPPPPPGPKRGQGLRHLFGGPPRLSR